MFAVNCKLVKMRVISPIIVIYRRSFMTLSSVCRRTTTTNYKHKQVYHLLEKNRSFKRHSLSASATAAMALASANMSTNESKTNYKELRLERYDIIGFDLDGTLLRYNLNETIPLEYTVLKEFLVKQKGYAPELLEKPMVWDFLQKGLILDGQRGNVLKLGHDATILRATHGTRLLTDLEIVTIYGADRKWDIATQFATDPLSTWNGPLSERIRAVLDYFDMPASLVFAQAVDIVDADAGGVQPETYTVYTDVHEGLMNMFSRENYATEQSAYFKAMRLDISRYVLRTSKETIDWLQNLRSMGKATFLLTGSNIDFANLTASRAFGENWRQLFDCVLCYAKKPGFFTMERPFLQVKNTQEMQDSELSTTHLLKVGNVYSQGNWQQLHAALSAKLNKNVDDVRAIYFGDNLIQDVYAPVAHRDIDAVAISEEMLTEPECSKISGETYSDATDSTMWGDYFSLSGTPTLWSAYITKYAQLCAPSVEHIARLPLTKSILSDNADGYYPSFPKVLKSIQPTDTIE